MTDVLIKVFGWVLKGGAPQDAAGSGGVRIGQPAREAHLLLEFLV